MDWARKIGAIPICPSIKEDTVVWELSESGNYSVKSGYSCAIKDYLVTKTSIKDVNRISQAAKLFCKKSLWSLPIPSTWKILLWKILTNSLPTREEFVKRTIQIDPVCPLCQSESSVETTAHLFRDCEVSKRIWAGSALGINNGYTDHVPIDSWIINWYKLFSACKENQTTIISFSSILWGIWIIRNKIIFQETTFSQALFFQVQEEELKLAISAHKAKIKREANDSTLNFSLGAGGISAFSV
ncbi:hypothetical protein KSS87_012605 [Heliosperma pusillum]|nr:hypothetical protein KSS87_012605 [Heliosperma pusillum]